MDRVEHLEGRLLDGGNNAFRDAAVFAGKGFRLRDRVFYHGRLFDHVAIFFFVGVGDTQQNSPKTGTPVAIARGKISSAVKGLAVWSEKRGEWPSALAADGLHGSLVAAVDVWTLVAIDLPRHKMFVQ